MAFGLVSFRVAKGDGNLEPFLSNQKGNIKKPRLFTLPNFFINLIFNINLIFFTLHLAGYI